MDNVDSQETYPSRSHCVTVESTSKSLSKSERYAEEYDAADVAHILRTSHSTFEASEERRNGLGDESLACAPFETEDEWELAKFLLKHVTQMAVDKFLKLNIVSGQIAPRVRN